MNHRSVLNGTPLDDRFTNVAREARELGYDPVLFGYTDSSTDPRGLAADDPRLRTYEGVLPGFSEGLVMTEDYAPWLEWLEGLGYPRPDRPHGIYDADPGYDSTGRGETWAPTTFPAEHSATAFLTDAVLEWLDHADPGWFVHLSYIRPHPPFRCPVEYHDRYDPGAVAGPPTMTTRSASGGRRTTG
jgi:hypothetical protein